MTLYYGAVPQHFAAANPVWSKRSHLSSLLFNSGVLPFAIKQDRGDNSILAEISYKVTTGQKC
jgi:hypothetical protein